jgi:hypothetical protein
MRSRRSGIETWSHYAAFSADSKRILTACEDRSLRLRNATTELLVFARGSLERAMSDEPRWRAETLFHQRQDSDPGYFRA